MLTEKYYGNFFIEPSGGGSIPAVPDEPSEPETYEPGMVVIEEQTVTTRTKEKIDWAVGMFPGTTVNAEELLVNFNGKDYLVPMVVVDGYVYYGQVGITDDFPVPSFTNFPFALCNEGDNGWEISTPEPGTHTISAKIPDGKGIPKILRITKAPRTVLNQLCRVSKALKSQNQTNNSDSQTLTPSAPLTPVGPGDGTVN